MGTITVLYPKGSSVTNRVVQKQGRRCLGARTKLKVGQKWCEIYNGEVWVIEKLELRWKRRKTDHQNPNLLTVYLRKKYARKDNLPRVISENTLRSQLIEQGKYEAFSLGCELELRRAIERHGGRHYHFFGLNPPQKK